MATRGKRRRCAVLFEDANFLGADVGVKFRGNGSRAVGRYRRPAEKFGRHPAQDVAEQNRRSQLITQIGKCRVKAKYDDFCLAGARHDDRAVLHLADFHVVRRGLKDVCGGQAQILGAQPGAKRAVRTPPLERNAFQARTDRNWRCPRRWLDPDGVRWRRFWRLKAIQNDQSIDGTRLIFAGCPEDHVHPRNGREHGPQQLGLVGIDHYVQARLRGQFEHGAVVEGKTVVRQQRGFKQTGRARAVFKRGVTLRTRWNAEPACTRGRASEAQPKRYGSWRGAVIANGCENVPDVRILGGTAHANLAQPAVLDRIRDREHA